jgi:hypothetical protein
MALEGQRYAVVLRHASCNEAAAHDTEQEQVTLVQADSHDALVTYPQLGELLAEAAFDSWRQQRTLRVVILTSSARI